VPLNHLDDDGSVECARCGLDQAFEVEMWKDMLELAHAVGDLAGPNPEGRHRGAVSIAAKNDHRTIGVQHTTCSKEDSVARFGAGGMSGTTLSVEVSPGFCLCPRCKVPLDAYPNGPGKTKTRCPQCAEEVHYAVPPRASAMLEALKAVVADDHRIGGAEAKLAAQTGSGAIGLLCPNCSAALPNPGNSSTVTCSYCRAVAFIPTKARFRISGAAPTPVPWWALFHGPSAKRAKLEGQVGGGFDDDDEDDDDEVSPPAKPSDLEASIAKSVERTQRTVRIVIVASVVGSLVLAGGITLATMLPADGCTSGADAPAAHPVIAPKPVPAKAPGRH
jgi:hypothetical protein